MRSRRKLLLGGTALTVVGWSAVVPLGRMVAAVPATAVAPTATAPATGPAATAPSPAAPPAARAPTTAPAATGPAADRIDALLARLAAADWRARERALAELAGLGEAAEPDLRRRLERDDLPVAVTDAVRGMLKGAAERRRVGPSLVTLHAREATPLQAVSAIVAQANLRLTPAASDLLGRRATPLPDVDLDRRTLWDALIDVGGRAGASVRSVGDDGVLDLAPADDNQALAPAAASGPFLLTIARAEVTQSRARNFAARRPNNALNVGRDPTVRLFLYPHAEPRVRAALWLADGIEVESAAGKPMTVVPWYGRSVQVNGGTEFIVSLAGDVGAAGRLAAVRVGGRFVLSARTDTQVLPTPPGTKELPLRVGGYRAVVQEVSAGADGSAAFEVAVYRDDRPPDDWQLQLALLERYGPRLLTADGQPLPQRGGNGSSGPSEWRQRRTFGGNGGRPGGGVGPPAKLEWTFPAAAEQVPAKFEFKDVPLP